ncbi:MAG: P27 family phage terminase small subunit, partial [Parasphingorhabdus sp.]
QRIDSNTAAVEVMRKAAAELMPPAHVELWECDMPFWHNIISEKAKSEWTPGDLEIAALLARALARLTEEENIMRGEESVITTKGGNLAANPRVRIIADCHARALKYRQTLGIHSRGRDGEKRDTDKRRAIAKEIEANNPLDDGLLARPN